MTDIKNRWIADTDHPEIFRLLECENDVDLFTHIYSRIIDFDSVIWQNLRKIDRYNLVRNIINDASPHAWEMGCFGKRTNTVRENIAFHVIELSRAVEDFEIQLGSKKVAEITVPIQLINNVTQNNSRKQLGLISAFKNLKDFLKPLSTEEPDIISAVVGVNMGEINASNTFDNDNIISLRLYHEPRPPTSKPVCTYLNWDIEPNENLTELKTGTECNTLSDSSQGYTNCECRQLHNFLIIVHIYLEKLSKSDEEILKYMFSILFILMTIGLLLIIYIHKTLATSVKPQITVAVNLAVNFLALNVLILVSLNSRIEKATNMCTVLSIGMQYFVLSILMWILVDGVFLYKIMNIIFELEKIRPSLLYGSAYGFPFIYVLLSLTCIESKTKGTINCWLPRQYWTNWLFDVFVFGISMVNFALFVVTFRASSKVRKIKYGKDSNERKKKKLLTKFLCHILYMLLISFTWSLYFNHLFGLTLTAYVFMALNGIEGMILFSEQIISSHSIKRRLVKFYKKYSTKPFFKSIKYSRQNSTSSRVFIAIDSKVKKQNGVPTTKKCGTADLESVKIAIRLKESEDIENSFPSTRIQHSLTKY